MSSFCACIARGPPSMSDIFDEAEAVDKVETDAESNHSQGTTRTTSSKKTKGGHSNKDSGAKKVKKHIVKAIEAKDKCFITLCPDKKRTGKKCCAKHERDVEAMSYQAKRSGESDFFDKMASDPTKLGLALADFDKNNPPGRFRKALIDWTQYKKIFAHKTERVAQEKEEQYTWQDWVDEKTAAGWEANRIDAAWNAMLANSKFERDGEGYNAEIWIPLRKARLRNTIKAVEARIEEGSKSMKNLKRKDMDVLKGFVANSGATASGDRFLHGMGAKTMGQSAVDD